MRVRFLASDPSLGANVPYGDSIRVRLLLDAFERIGADLDVRWARPEGTPAPGPVGPAPERRLPESVLQLARDARSLLRAARFAPQALEGTRPDVVFEFASYLAPIGLLAARRFRVPYLVEVEGPLGDLRYEQGGASLRVLGDLLERRRLRAAAAVITVSQPLAEYLIASGARPDRTTVIPNVADTRRFTPDALRRAEVRARLGVADRVVVGFHGVFSPWYGLDTLVEAVVGRPDLALLLVGDGVERERIEAIIRAAGASDQVIVTGFVPHDEVPGYVDAFDIGAVPDHVWWTSPLKLFEYGAMRKPVVAAQARSIDSIVGRDEAFLVPPREPHALGEAFQRLADDPALRESLADRWAAKVQRDYNPDQLAQKLADVIERARLPSR